MAVDVECPKCHAELELNGRRALAADTFTCARCGKVSPIPDVLDTDAPPKSSVAAGLLQLFFGYLGLGRFYLGYTAMGIIQLSLWITGLLMLVLGWLLFFVFSLIGFVILIALGIWILVEAIMMIAGAIPDADGRKLA